MQELMRVFSITKNKTLHAQKSLNFKPPTFNEEKAFKRRASLRAKE